MDKFRRGAVPSHCPNCVGRCQNESGSTVTFSGPANSRNGWYPDCCVLVKIPQVLSQQALEHSYHALLHTRSPTVQRMFAENWSTLPSSNPFGKASRIPTLLPKVLDRYVPSDVNPSHTGHSFSPTANMPSACTAIVITTLPSFIKRNTHQAKHTHLKVNKR